MWHGPNEFDRKSVGWWLQVGASGAVLSVLLNCGDTAPAIEIVEIARAALPADFRPDRFATGPSGAVVVLSSATRSAAIITSDTSRVHLLADGAPPVGARFPTVEPSIIEVMDAEGFVTQYIAGDPVLRTSSGAPVAPSHAAPAPRGWFVAGRNEDALELYWLTDRWTYLTAVSLDAYAGEIFLTSSGDTAILTFGRAPFAALMIDTGASVVFQHVMHAKRSGKQGSVTGFPAVPLGEHVLRTFAHHERDFYDAMVYDARGRLVRTTRLPAPMVFVTRTGEGDRLFAMRNFTGAPELAVYSWRVF